jgi:hypothetical protein
MSCQDRSPGPSDLLEKDRKKTTVLGLIRTGPGPNGYIPYLLCPSLTYNLLPFLVAIPPGMPFLRVLELLP